MGKPRTRVAQQAAEARQRSAEVQQKIKMLSTQISNPQKYFGPPPDSRTRSAAELFRRYFMVGGGVSVHRRKPTRAELRAQRTRAIIWAMSALILLMWVCGRVWQAYKMK